MNCLIYAYTPVNPYLLVMNITINEIEIADTVSVGFDPAWLSSANAAMLFFEHIFELTASNIKSVDNRNLTILNVNDVQFVSVSDYSCFSTLRSLYTVENAVL